MLKPFFEFPLNFSHYTITHKSKSETNHKILIKKLKIIAQHKGQFVSERRQNRSQKRTALRDVRYTLKLTQHEQLRYS